MNFVALDFETTGFKPPYAEVVEFAACRVRDGEIYQTLSSLCRPLRGINPAAAEVNGITYGMVRNKPVFSELLPLLLEFIGSDTVVCHNAPFDMNFLCHYCRAEGFDVSFNVDDTLKLARKLLPFLPSKSLEPLARHFGIESSGFHRAEADTVVTAKLYMELIKLRV